MINTVNQGFSIGSPHSYYWPLGSCLAAATAAGASLLPAPTRESRAVQHGMVHGAEGKVGVM